MDARDRIVESFLSSVKGFRRAVALQVVATYPNGNNRQSREKRGASQNPKYDLMQMRNTLDLIGQFALQCAQDQRRLNHNTQNLERRLPHPKIAPPLELTSFNYI